MSEAVQAGLIHPAGRISTGVAHHRSRGRRIRNYYFYGQQETNRTAVGAA